MTTTTVIRERSLYKLKMPHYRNCLFVNYKLVCHSCKKSHVRQTGRCLTAQCKEHITNIRTKNHKSAYTIHILYNQYEYSPNNSTIDLLRHCKKGVILNSWQNYQIQEYQMKGQETKHASSQHSHMHYLTGPPNSTA